jgi:hypothetical protein
MPDLPTGHVSCDGCGKRVSADQRVWIEHRNGRIVAAALRDIDPDDPISIARVWHGGCTVNPRPGN